MGSRVGTLIAFVVVLAAGVLLGSGVVEWFGGGKGAGGEIPAAADAPGLGPGPGRITVEVLNAGGRDGMAREATDRLRALDFDVVSFGNADAFDEVASVVLDRVERPAAAREVARALGIGSVRSEPDPNLLVDVTVRIGSDWAPADAPPAPVGGEDGTPWWDVRRFLPEEPPGDTGDRETP